MEKNKTGEKIAQRPRMKSEKRRGEGGGGGLERGQWKSH